MSSILKIGRLTIALLFFIPIVLFFCDFAGALPDSLHWLMAIQVVPAILSGSLLVLFVLFLLTITLGRVYCSIICPLGILQDVISRFSGKRTKKNRKKRWFRFSNPYHYLRYGILAICIVLLLIGILSPVMFLDPYSNFGRIASNLFRPLVIWGNNGIHWLAIKAGNFNFYHVSIHTVTKASLVGAGTMLLLIFVMSFTRGRLFCNTICPVGSLLGAISRFSIFRIVMSENRCNNCGSCERACKSECINSKKITVDNSRCVACFNCLSRCKQQAISYDFAWRKKVQREIRINAPVDSDIKMSKQPVNQSDRRSFLATGTAIVATLPLIPAWANSKEEDVTKKTPVTPPGSKNLKQFNEKCTACHLCVTHCPQQMLVPAGFNFGFNYLFKPHMVYRTAYCNFECTVCSEICPTGAIQKLTMDEKKTTQVGIAQFDVSRCIVELEGTDCGACSEHCPTQAVKMVPYKESLRIPEVTDNLCVGCGGCEYICPVRPLRAINVLANNVHQKSEKPKEEAAKEYKVTEFGF